MRKIYLFVVGIILFIPNLVLANSIENINIDIYIDNIGTAHVTETWNAKLDEGTEGYKPYYNIGNSIISNFHVKMNDINYTFIDDWNTNDTFSNKKYKNGFNYIVGGVELCFGISEYGLNTYTLTYDISNFVVNTSDNYQMIYWTLFPYNYSSSPSEVKVKIYSDFQYADTIDVWGYGKGGMPTYVYDGVIEVDSNGKINSNEYITLLVKFPSGSFDLLSSVDNTFDYYYQMAEEGAVHYDSDTSNWLGIFLSILYICMFVLLTIIVIIGIKFKPKHGTYRIIMSKDKIKGENVPYFRDLPYKKEKISRAFWIASQYNIIVSETDYLGAVLLKWLKMGNIKLKKEDSNDKEKTKIALNSCGGLNEKEIKLYQMMYEASKDGILEKKEFESWCKKNYQKIFTWFNNVIDEETESLIKEGYLIREGKKKKCTVTPKLDEEAKKVIGLKKFLKDFSNINDRSAIEVNLWDEYLMYATIFGIAKKVMKDFKDMYPEVITEEIYYDYDFIYFISYHGMSSATTARDKAQSYSSGGGGFSSSGGGGGSFGGGGGGGGFR